MAVVGDPKYWEDYRIYIHYRQLSKYTELRLMTGMVAQGSLPLTIMLQQAETMLVRFQVVL